MTEKNPLSRRDFIKGAALATGAGLLASCAPKVADTSKQAGNGSAAGQTASTADWLGEEPKIDNIAETIESDVIVIGAGTGGAYAAASLLEKGLKVAIVEKNKTVAVLRNDWGSVDSKWQKAEGVKLDKAAILHYHTLYCSNRLDQRLPKIWLNESGAAITWIGEIFEKRGGKFYYEGGYEPDFSSGTYPKFPTGHSGRAPDGSADGSKMMKEYIEEMGGKYYFETTFVKFEHEGKKVTSAIAKNKDGKYVRFVGKKGIVLSTGGYQNNPDMLNALQPADVMIMAKPSTGPNAGDGIKACLWMGAAMDECHSSMLFDRMGLLPSETAATMTAPTMFWLGSQPWLKVNLKGERFTNESVPYDFILHAAAHQPGATYCAIMDSTWFDQVQKFQSVGCSRIFPYPNGVPNDVFLGAKGLADTGTDLAAIKKEWDGLLAEMVKSGHLQQADTPEDLAKKLNIPADVFAATFKRYNEMADKGADEDFFKDAYRFLPIKNPPYYGIRLTGWLLTTLDGIHIDTEMRPLDANSEPFEGLYVIGDTSGSYFAHTYPNLFTGYANGRTTTFARRVARVIAGEQVDL